MIALGADANSALLTSRTIFPNCRWCSSNFSSTSRGQTGPTGRNLFCAACITSALQTDQQLSQVYEDDLAESFSPLPEAEHDKHTHSSGKKISDRSYFITDTFAG